jgi:hypothetical protein
MEDVASGSFPIRWFWRLSLLLCDLGMIPMEGDTFEALFWAMRFHIGFHMGICKFA